MFKKTLVSLAMIGASASAFAGMPKDQVVMPTGVNLLAPDSAETWMIGLEALYVRVAGSNITYAQSGNASVPVQTIDNEILKSSSQFGGTIDLGYMFPTNSRDIQLVYTHLDTADSAHSPNFFFDGVTGHSRYDYNAGDVVVGQWIRIGDRVDLHPFAGLRYASIDMHDKFQYGSSAVPAFSYAAVRYTNEYRGIGPRLGIDAAAHVGSGVSVVSTVGASLLIGNLYSKYTVEFPVTGGLTDNRNGNIKQVVPEVDARLGLHYDYMVTPATALGAELGYQAVNYFDVSQKGFIDTVAPNTTHSQNNFAYYGPYFRLQMAIS